MYKAMQNHFEETLPKGHISYEHLLDNLAFDEKSNNLMRNVFEISDIR